MFIIEKGEEQRKLKIKGRKERKKKTAQKRRGNHEQHGHKKKRTRGEIISLPLQFPISARKLKKNR